MKGIDICNNGTGGMLLSDFLEPSLVVENKVKHGRRLPDVASSNENMRKLEVKKRVAVLYLQCLCFCLLKI